MEIADRDAMRRFGKPYEGLDEDETGELAVWACKGYGVDLARLYAAREGFLVLGRLLALYAAVDEERRGLRGEAGFVEAIAEAQAVGSPAALERLADALEPTWHDERLGDARIIAAVEGVEALRAIVRRMRACGMLRLADGLPGCAARPLPRDANPTGLVLDLLGRLYGPLDPAQVGAISAGVDAGWGLDVAAVLAECGSGREEFEPG